MPVHLRLTAPLLVGHMVAHRVAGAQRAGRVHACRAHRRGGVPLYVRRPDSVLRRTGATGATGLQEVRLRRLLRVREGGVQVRERVCVCVCVCVCVVCVCVCDRNNMCNREREKEDGEFVYSGCIV